MKFFFTSSDNKESLLVKEKYELKYGKNSLEDSDIIVPIGGDGYLLKTLHDYKDAKKSFYGINYGSVGFLMNKESDADLADIIHNSQKIQLKPLNMLAKNNEEKIYESIAFNEVALMRQTHQASKIRIIINDIERMDELICDGILVSTAAGSTAYNLSAHGSIIPLEAKLLALTPISSFRPRRWRGALLSEKTKIKFIIKDDSKRPVSVTADHNEFRNIKEVKISSSEDLSFNLLFDNNNSMNERILKEQFFS